MGVERDALRRAPLLERGRELASIEDVLRSAEAGQGRLLVLEGQAGIGKSELLRAARAVAEESGMSVLTARGGELERSFTFGLVLQLFEAQLRTGTPAEREDIFSGAAGLSRPLFERTSDQQPLEDQDLALLHGVYWLCANLAERAPLLLAVDDLHWADASSLRFLIYLAQRLDDLPIAVVVTLRRGEVAALNELIAQLAGHSVTSAVRIPALSGEAVETLVRYRFPEAQGTFCAACARVSGGNPHLLRELLLALASEGLEQPDEAAERVSRLAPDSVLRAVLARLASLPEAASALARAVAVLGEEADLRHAAALSGLDLASAAAAADGLAAAEVLGTGQPLSFLHPLLRSAVYADIPPAKRGLLHLNAARLLAEEIPPERVAVYLLAAPATGDPWVVSVLRAAARHALAAASPDSAVRYLTRALEEPPARDERPRLLVELGEAEAAAGADGAVGRLEESLLLTSDGRGRAETMLRLGWMLHKSGRMGEAADVFERGLREVVPDDPLAVELEVAYLGVGWYDSRRAEEVVTRRRALLASPEKTPTSAERGLLTQQIVQEVSAGDPHLGVRVLAERLLDDGGLLEEEGADSYNLWIAIAALSWADDLARAEAAIEAALVDIRRRGNFPSGATAFYTRSWPRFWTGRIGEALADAQAAVSAWRGGWGMYLPGAMYWLARAHIERGELDEAEAALELPDAEERWGGTTMYAAWQAARGRVALMRGRADEALDELLASGTLLKDTLLLKNPAIGEWRSEAALAAAQLGDRPRARELVEEEVALARRFGAPRPIGVALRAAGLVAGGKEGVDLLREAVGVLETSPAKLELGRALIDLGAVLRRAGRRADAREPLRRGLEMVERFGAFRLERQAREELAATGARVGRRAFSGRDSLTPSERRVAEMAAAGMSNREIAQSLFVTVNAVKWHLRNAYRKLDVKSREDLAATLEIPPSVGDATATASGTGSHGTKD